MRQEGSIRPTQQGIPIAKDVWMLGIAGGFIIDEIFSTKAQAPVQTIVLYGDDADADIPVVSDDLEELVGGDAESPRSRFVIVSGPKG